MSIAFISRPRWQSISRYVVEWRHRIRSRNELLMLSDLNMAGLRFSKVEALAEARAEAAKWLWQP